MRLSNLTKTAETVSGRTKFQGPVPSSPLCDAASTQREVREESGRLSPEEVRKDFPEGEIETELEE